MGGAVIGILPDQLREARVWRRSRGISDESSRDP